MSGFLVVTFFVVALYQLGQGRWQWLALYLLSYAVGGVYAVSAAAVGAGLYGLWRLIARNGWPSMPGTFQCPPPDRR